MNVIKPLSVALITLLCTGAAMGQGLAKQIKNNAKAKTEVKTQAQPAKQQVKQHTATKNTKITGSKNNIANNQKTTDRQVANNIEKAPTAQANKIAGDKFLKKKAAAPGYIKTQSGLVYKVIKDGNGAFFTASDTILTKYVGKHIDGKEFDSSNGQAIPFLCDHLIPGFAEMLQLMKPGMKVEVIIPSDLAYGPQGAGPVVGPDETLIFELETVGKQAPDAF